MSKLAAAAFPASHEVDGCHDFVSFVLVGIFLLGLLVVLDGVFTVSDGVSFVLVGALFWFVVYLCLLGGRPPKEEKVFCLPICSTSLKQSCHFECYPVLVQGSGEHGAVSSLLVRVGQASGRVDLPDGPGRAKFKIF